MNFYCIIIIIRVLTCLPKANKCFKAIFSHRIFLRKNFLRVLTVVRSRVQKNIKDRIMPRKRGPISGNQARATSGLFQKTSNTRNLSSKISRPLKNLWNKGRLSRSMFWWVSTLEQETPVNVEVIIKRCWHLTALYPQ